MLIHKQIIYEFQKLIIIVLLSSFVDSTFILTFYMLRARIWLCGWQRNCEVCFSFSVCLFICMNILYITTHTPTGVLYFIFWIIIVSCFFIIYSIHFEKVLVVYIPVYIHNSAYSIHTNILLYSASTFS